MEHILRQSLVSLRMAELLAFDEAEREAAYFSGLLAWVGCHTDAYEQAKWFGDDIALKRDGYHYDMGRPVDVLNFALHTVGRGRPPLGETQDLGGAPAGGTPKRHGGLRNHWLAADELASRLGLGEPVRRSLRESFERWDGKGFGGARGEEIRLTSRVVCLADVVTAYHEQGGENAAVQVAWQDQARSSALRSSSSSAPTPQRALRSRRTEPVGAGYRCRADACPSDDRSRVRRSARATATPSAAGTARGCCRASHPGSRGTPRR
jgi:hypothetical protein